MDIKGQKVIHKTLGEGIIVDQTESQIIVEFKTKTSKFIYPSPDTFEKFLKLTNPVIHEMVMHELEAHRDAEEKAKMTAESAKTAERAQCKTTVKREKPSQDKEKLVDSSIKRIPNKPKMFYVFQGGTFESESKGGFIWAPKYNQNGKSIFHWDNLLLVKKGDVILHGYNGYTVAVSVAVSDCYDSDRPKGRTFEDLWDSEGRQVDLKYTIFENPIKTSDYRDEIIEHCKYKYSPFDKFGNGNMGYLYEIDYDLANIILQAVGRRNTHSKVGTKSGIEIDFGENVCQKSKAQRISR